MAASFSSNRWPAVGTLDHEGILRFVLKDGTEIERQKLQSVGEDDGRPKYIGLHPNGRTILGPRGGSHELVYLKEDENWFSR